ncbi:MAG: hypothetical protein AAGG01_17515, partial [Planctomycetota bacterium]
MIALVLLPSSLLPLLVPSPFETSRARPYAAQEAAPAEFELAQMAGVWGVETVFGPEVQGSLILRKEGDGWTADLQGHVASVTTSGHEWSFDLPGEKGSFRGRAHDGALRGFWYQPKGTVFGSRYATPVELTRVASDVWLGDVIPHPERISLYVEFVREGDGLLARMRNPERNVGAFYDLGKVELRGRSLQFFDAPGETVLLEGRLAASGDRFSIDLEGGGATLEFRRRGRDTAAGYYPGDSTRSPYTYRVPMAGDDGWECATPAEVDLKVEPLEALVQSILDTRYESRSTPYLHSV